MNTTEERFWSKVKVSGLDECWLWQASCFENGYGQFSICRQNFKAHRKSYEFVRGSIPSGLVVRHSCDNKKCVNPVHLSVGTSLDNIHDCMTRNPNSPNLRKGSKVSLAKFTESQIVYMRSQYSGKRGQVRALARQHNVHEETIRCILKRKTWRHI